MGTGGRHSHGGPSAAAAAAAAIRPGLPLRRYSVPEVVMRKASLRQRAAVHEADHTPTKKQDAKRNPPEKEVPPPPQQDDPKQAKNISFISEHSVVKCETTSQCFSMTLSSSTTTECKVSVTTDVPKVPEPCSKTSDKKEAHISKEEADGDPSRLDSITERLCSTTVGNSDTAAKEMTEEDQEVQHIMSDKRSSTPACCRRHRRLSPLPCSASPPCEDVSPEIATSPMRKNRPDSASSSVTLDQSVSERSSSTQDSTLSVRSEANSPCEGRQKRTATPYNRFDKKAAIIRDVCGNKVHVLSETSSFIVFETPSPSPSPSPSPPCHPYPNEMCCCVCTCCKKCERECNVRTKRMSQTTQTTEDKTTSVNSRDRRSTNVKPQPEQSSVIVDSTIGRDEDSSNDYVPDLFGVDSNGNVTFCLTGDETHRRQSVPRSQYVQTNNEDVPEDTKPKDTYLVKTETIEKWENDKREWTEKRVSHSVQHQSGPPVRDAKTYTLSNKINIANNNPTLVASEIVEIPLHERHTFCPNNEQNPAATCPMCQEEKKEVNLPSIKTSDAQNLKTEADFWNKLMGQSARAQTNIPKIGETQQVKESAPQAAEDLYPWSKLPESTESQCESTVVDVTTVIDGTEATVVPRYSAVPRTVSMLVNTSSAEVSDSDSECLSCADSLESIHVPRKSNKHDSKPVRGHVLLAESAHKKDVTRRIKPSKVYFIRLSEDDNVVEGDLTPVSECLPKKLKEKLVERHTSVRHTEHCRHHEAERHRHSRNAHHDSHQDIPHENTKGGSPQYKSMASQAVTKECATKSTSTQRSRSKREVPAIVRVHKCHLEEDVRPMFKAKPYKGVTASTLKTKPSKPPPAPSEPPKLEPKSKPRKKAVVSHPSEATPQTIHLKQDLSTLVEDTVKINEKSDKLQPSRDTQTTPSTAARKEDTAKTLHKLHNFNHAMQTQTTPPKSVETLTVNLDDDGKRVAKSSQTEVNKNRPTSRQTTLSDKTKPRREVVSSPAVKADQSKTLTMKVNPRQTRATTTEILRRKDAPKTVESTSETENIVGESDEMTDREGSTADRKLETSSPTPQRLTTPRRSGSIARFRHKFPVIPEEQREVSPSSPSRSCLQRRSPAVITSLNAMSQTEPTEPNDMEKNGRVSSSSNTDGSRSENDHESKPMQYTVKVRTSPDFNSQSQQTDTFLHLQSKQPMNKTNGGTQTDRADITKQTTPVCQSAWVDAATSTETHKSDASTSTLTPRSSVSSATIIQKEMTKTSTTTQKGTTKSTSTQSTDTITKKETTKSTCTQSSPTEREPVKLPQKSNAAPDKSTQGAPKSLATKQSITTNTKTSTESTKAAPAVTKITSASSAIAMTKDAVRPVAPKVTAAPGKPSASATSTDRTRGSWSSRGASLDSNVAYNRRKAAAVEHVNRLQRLLHRRPAASLSARDDVSSGGSCPSDSTNYLSPPEMSTSPGWGAGDDRVITSASLGGRRHIRPRPVRRDPTVSTDRQLYRHHEPPRLAAPGPPPSDGAGWTVTVAGGSNVGSVVGGVSSSVDPNNGAPELEMRLMIAETSTIPKNHSAGSSRWSLTIRNQPIVSADHQQALSDSAPCQNRRPPSLIWPTRVQHLVNGSASPRQSDSSPHQLSVTGSAIKRKFSRHLD